MKVTKKTQLTLSAMSFIFLLSCSPVEAPVETPVETPVERKTGDEISLKCIKDTGGGWGDFNLKIGVNECANDECVTWDTEWIKIIPSRYSGYTMISREDLSFSGQFGNGPEGKGMCEIIDTSKRAL